MTAKRYIFFTWCLMAAGVAGCETIQESLSLNKPTARLTDLKIEDVKLDSATLLFDVEIENHYPVALPLTNFDYSLSSGAEKFLSGNAESQAAVPAKSSRTVSLPAKFNYIEMLKALKGVRPGSTIPYAAELGLSVNTPGLGVIRLPLKKEGELILPNVTGADIIDIWNIIKPK
ncbi:MAG: LEA type 2 family protein [Planctomycetes bacterium]|nr:LEA type 2 family protein [Planctomycetota bacterium]MBL7144083.1 LEA type 2 family protein [Phycisphaerae bacterium]